MLGFGVLWLLGFVGMGCRGKGWMRVCGGGGRADREVARVVDRVIRRGYLIFYRG